MIILGWHRGQILLQHEVLGLRHQLIFQINESVSLLLAFIVPVQFQIWRLSSIYIVLIHL